MQNPEEYGRVGLDDAPRFADRARDRVQDVRARLAEADRTVRNFVQEHPFVALLGALALGYGAGRLLRKL